MKNKILASILIVGCFSAIQAGANSNVPFHKWVVQCDGGKASLSGAPYSKTTRTLTWDFDSMSSDDATETKILPPFTDPSSNGSDPKKIQSVNVTPIFAPECRSQCNAQQLAIHVDYVTSGMQDGVGMSADYADVIVPIKPIAVGESISLENTWVGTVNDCDRGNCIRDISGNETLSCVVQSIQY
jgi:hypothetical protein